MVITQCKESPVVQNQIDLVEQKKLFQKAFNEHEFDSVISFDFKVNWQMETKGYSEELETVYYEYLIEPKSLNGGGNRTKQGRQNQTVYKLIAIEQSGQSLFYVLKLYGSSEENKKQLSWENLKGFSGLLIVTDNFGNEVIVSRIRDGDKIGEGKAISQERLELIQSGRMKIAETCYTEIVYHYIHWYQQNPDGSWFYLDSQYLGSSSYEVCYGGTSGGGDPIGGDTGGGSYGDDSPPDNGDYQDCPDTVHGCYHDVEDKFSLFLGDIIKDPSLSEFPKAECVFNNLSLTNTFEKILGNFTNSQSNYNLRVGVTSLNTNVNGILESSNLSNTYKLLLNSNNINSRKPIEIAITILHEAIHAEMRRYLYGADDISTLTGFPHDFNDDWISFVESLYGGNPGAPEHEVMAAKYIDLIADGLSEFDGGSLTRQEYEALAWIGLQGTDYYTQLLSESERSEIENSLESAKNSASNACN